MHPNRVSEARTSFRRKSELRRVTAALRRLRQTLVKKAAAHVFHIARSMKTRTVHPPRVRLGVRSTSVRYEKLPC